MSLLPWAVALVGASCFLFFNGDTNGSAGLEYVADALDTTVLSGVELAVFTSSLGFVLSSRSGVIVGKGPIKNFKQSSLAPLSGHL